MTEKLVIARKRFAKDRFAAALGITLDQLTDNSVTMHMQLSEDMVNWFDRPHGGAVYCLADAAFSVLANNGETLAVALECSITYHASPPSDALLVVEGETLSATRKTAAYLFKVYMENAESRAPVATMKSVAYRTRTPIDSTVKY